MYRKWTRRSVATFAGAVALAFAGSTGTAAAAAPGLETAAVTAFSAPMQGGPRKAQLTYLSSEFRNGGSQIPTNPTPGRPQPTPRKTLTMTAQLRDVDKPPLSGRLEEAQISFAVAKADSSGGPFARCVSKVTRTSPGVGKGSCTVPVPESPGYDIEVRLVDGAPYTANPVHARAQR